MNIVKRLLSHKLTADLSLDDPKTTELRRIIIKEKSFLCQIYDDWYRLLLKHIPLGPGKVLEIGSGGGFLNEYCPDLITSDVIRSTNVALVFDACHKMPFADDELKAIIMLNVFHHFPKPENFLSEAERCLKPGGVILLIEPYVTNWSRFVYSKLHHEPFDESTPEWRFNEKGPLSGANIALPWIVFCRDETVFTDRFPHFTVEKILQMMPFCYLLSGGVSMISLFPGIFYPVIRRLEKALCRLTDKFAMFALIIIRKS